MPFRLTQPGHKLTLLPAIVCTETTSFHHKGAPRCPAESASSHCDRSDSDVTLHSPRLSFHLHYVPKHLFSCLSFFFFYFNLLQLPRLFLSRSLPFRARTLYQPSLSCQTLDLCLALFLSWRQPVLPPHSSYLCGCPLMYVFILHGQMSLLFKLAGKKEKESPCLRGAKNQSILGFFAFSLSLIIRIVADYFSDTFSALLQTTELD